MEDNKQMLSAAALALPKIEISNELIPLSKEEKLDKLLDIISDIEVVGDYAVIKFNTSVLIASPDKVAVVAKTEMVLKTVEGALHLN